MDLMLVMTIFVLVSAVALVVQAGLLFGIYKASRKMQENVQRVIPKVELLVPKIESLVEASRQTIEDSRKQILDITSKTSDILETTRVQIKRVDLILEDATSRVKNQLDRAEMVLDDAMTRAHETVATVHGGLMKPLREIQGVTTGIRTAFLYFMRGRPNPSEAHADEEMFI